MPFRLKTEELSIFKQLMIWKNYITGFKNYLLLERSLSNNSVEAYVRDVEQFSRFVKNELNNLSPKKIEQSHIRLFIKSPDARY